MKLKDILSNLPLEKKLAKVEIKGISVDSRLVKGGDLFFIKERESFDVLSVLKEIERRVKVFVAEEKLKNKLRSLFLKRPIIFTKHLDVFFRAAADKFYGFNTNDFTFIGITGTKGKTTTGYLIRHILKKFNRQCALLSTIEYLVGDKSHFAKNTTPDYLSLRKLFKEIKACGAKYVVMEVSSHGIEQGRIAGIEFSRCIFTNLKREHLDYHKTMHDYFNVKKNFFTVNKNAAAIINIDDPAGRKIIKEVGNAVTYGTNHNACLRATDIRLSKTGINFKLHYGSVNMTVRAAILGRHNVYNVLAAIGTALSLNFSLGEIVKSVGLFRGVEGRLEEVSSGVFVDYAHTPDSLQKALSAVKDIGYGKVICVFGCGGNRDKGKRRLMGKVASNLADFTIITADNPRNENVSSICAQIEKGFERGNYSVLIDRQEAIEQAIRLKKKYVNSCLLVAGKGHENYQIVGDDKIPFKDKEVIQGFLKKCS